MPKKINWQTIKKYKTQGKKVAMLTCYDYSMANLLEKAGVDSLLVGDTLGQLVLGYPSTIHAKMDIMIALTAAVRRGAPNVCLMGDMPFLSYQVSIEQAIINAGRFMTEGGCDVVKIEVDSRHLDVVAAMARAGIPVVAHLGFKPQSATLQEKMVATRQIDHARQLINDAENMVKAGACGLLLECVTANTAKAVTKRTDVPVISCGSGPDCDGQVLVLHDMLNLAGAANPKFNKTYANIGQAITDAAKQYAKEIHTKKFPTEINCYNMTANDQKEFQNWLDK
ncbi:MAG: 3-methyl-2-oxobutanoate hydroxymethyltransferase [Phycisphaerae bacterium]|nr:3-methyl-2-oxobutanoate hydroxymethyltransferase [Phycisphaerae bacterium]